jgi:hypothetical protein
LADRGTGRGLTRRGLADLGRGLAVRGLADLGRGPAVRGQADLGRGMDLVDRDLAARALGRRTDRGDLVDRDPADQEDLAERDPADQEDLAERDPADQEDLAERDPTDQEDLAERDPTDQEDLAERDPADQEDPADPADQEDLADPVDRDRVDQGRGALTIGAMPRWVAPWMRLAASVHATTARHPHRETEDSAGMMGVRPVGRRLTGSARRLRGVGMVLRRPVVGTTRGTDRTAA